METPEPRVALGQAAARPGDECDRCFRRSGRRPSATCSVARAWSAIVEVDAVPRSPRARGAAHRPCSISACSTAATITSSSSPPPPSGAPEVTRAGAEADVAVTRIGRIDAGDGLRVVDGRGLEIDFDRTSFDHFRS